MTPEMIMGIVILMLSSFFMGGAVGKAIARDEAKEALEEKEKDATIAEPKSEITKLEERKNI